jgi:hypothetical protein
MKFAKLMIALTLTISPLLAAAQLSTSDRIRTTVPFEFIVAGRSVPAGECDVQTNNMQGSILRISSGTSKVNLLSSVSPFETESISHDYALVFYRYGDHYFLRGVKVEGTRIVYTLPESKVEKEIRAQNLPVTEKILVASRQ